MSRRWILPWHASATCIGIWGGREGAAPFFQGELLPSHPHHRPIHSLARGRPAEENLCGDSPGRLCSYVGGPIEHAVRRFRAHTDGPRAASSIWLIPPLGIPATPAVKLATKRTYAEAAAIPKLERASHIYIRRGGFGMPLADKYVGHFDRVGNLQGWAPHSFPF